MPLTKNKACTCCGLINLHNKLSLITFQKSSVVVFRIIGLLRMSLAYSLLIKILKVIWGKFLNLESCQRPLCPLTFGEAEEGLEGPPEQIHLIP